MGRLRSGFERTLAAQLKRLKVEFINEPFQIPFVLHRTYTPDFQVGEVLIEAKGVLDDDDRRKMVAVKEQHPELDIRFVFMKADNKVPGLKSTHAEWATRNGFKWADKEIPKEWLIKS